MNGDLDVIGMGNALVDVLCHESDAFLDRHALVKGTMHLVDEPRARRLYEAMGPAVEVSGGSAANRMVGVASFGGRAHYVGKVRDDQLGEVFSHDLRATGVGYTTATATSGPATGRCLIVVTPDAQRTMSTYLGASTQLGPGDVDPRLVARGRRAEEHTSELQSHHALVCRLLVEKKKRGRDRGSRGEEKTADTQHNKQPMSPHA